MSATAGNYSKGYQAAALAALLGFGGMHAAYGQQSPGGGTPMTGKLMMERLPSGEFTWFVTGMVEGMAYARFRKDSLASGTRSEDGMNCILRWYRDNPRSITVVMDAFQQHQQHMPWVVLGALLKKECGE